MARILVVDDDAHIAASLAERFKARGHQVLTAASGADALASARRNLPDVILLDLQLPHGDGLSVLKTLRDEGTNATVVVITAYGTIEKAVEAMKSGAYDFLQKPFEPSLVEETVRRALERSTLQRENLALKSAAPDPGIVAGDPKMQELLKQAEKAARSNATVLVLGESGSGKEVLARQIHRWSPRAAGPFVAVNCVALNENLLESELFGHEKGAFTGAASRHAGKIEVANGGTLFLDEIGDVSPAFQAKLLRVLETSSFERVGGSETIQIDVRFVAATNRDLKARVEEGAFRQDLFFRLNVISLTLPPLRERRGDIGPLLDRFVSEFGRGRVTLADDARKILESYPWPGNVRELRNVVERAVVLCEGGVIGSADLPPDLVGASDTAGSGFHAEVERFRRKLIEETLARFDGNQTRAAEALGLQRTYLARLIKQLQVGR